jgi:hypothetical protein
LHVCERLLDETHPFHSDATGVAERYDIDEASVALLTPQELLEMIQNSYVDGDSWTQVRIFDVTDQIENA